MMGSRVRVTQAAPLLKSTAYGRNCPSSDRLKTWIFRSKGNGKGNFAEPLDAASRSMVASIIIGPCSFMTGCVRTCSRMLTTSEDCPMAAELEELLSRRELRQIIPKCEMTIYRWERDGKFPRSIKINKRKYWRKSEVRQWQA